MFKSNIFLPKELQIDEATFNLVLNRLKVMTDIEDKEGNTLMVPGMKYSSVILKEYIKECKETIRNYYEYDLSEEVVKEEVLAESILEGQLDFLNDAKFELTSGVVR